MWLSTHYRAALHPGWCLCELRKEGGDHLSPEGALPGLLSQPAHAMLLTQGCRINIAHHAVAEPLLPHSFHLVIFPYVLPH